MSAAGRDIFLSVVAPIQTWTPELWAKLRAVDAMARMHARHAEIIVIDRFTESSTLTDDIQTQFQFATVRVIRTSEHVSFDEAAFLGFGAAIGDYLVLVDLETDPIERIPEALKLASGGATVCLRVSRSKARFFSLRYWASLLFIFVCQRILVDPQHNTLQFRCFGNIHSTRFNILKSRTKNLKTFTYQLRAPIIYLSTGPTQSRVSPFWESLNYALEFLIESTMNPLRMVSRLSLVAAGVSFLYVLYIFGIIPLEENRRTWLGHDLFADNCVLWPSLYDSIVRLRVSSPHRDQVHFGLASFD